MKTASKLIAAATFALVLTSCASGQRGPRFKPSVINRALATAPGEAQPSAVVATEVAYLQAAREKGYFAAARDFAASGAQIHGPTGPLAFATVANALSDDDAAQGWGPRTVVMSCTGSLALSVGRYLDKEGLVGTYVTTWVRQKDNSYKWSYDVAGVDDPQPPPRPDFEDSLITVTAIDSVLGLIADCPTESAAAQRPRWTVAQGAAHDEQVSDDNSLIWGWEHRPDGTRYVQVHYYYEGEWVKAVEEGLASPS